MHIWETQQEIHHTALEKGWWDDDKDPEDPRDLAASLALIHSEVSEALECLRINPCATHKWISEMFTGKPEGFVYELADVVIRVLDLYGALGVDGESLIAEKMRYNRTRPHRHGGKAL